MKLNYFTFMILIILASETARSEPACLNNFDKKLSLDAKTPGENPTLQIDNATFNLQIDSKIVKKLSNTKQDTFTIFFNNGIQSTNEQNGLRRFCWLTAETADSIKLLYEASGKLSFYVKGGETEFVFSDSGISAAYLYLKASDSSNLKEYEFSFSCWGGNALRKEGLKIGDIIYNLGNALGSCQ